MRKVFALLFLTQLVVIMDRMASHFLGPFLVRDLHLTPPQVGTLAAATGVCWAVSALGFGIVADRVGRRAVLIPSVLVFSLCSVLSAFARDFSELLVARALLGLAEGPCFAVTMALAEAWAPSGQRARWIGRVNSAGPLAACITPLFVTQVALWWNWRIGFLAVALPGLVLAGMLWRHVHEPTSASTGQRAHAGGNAYTVFANRQLWWCLVGAFGLVASVIPFIVFAPLYLTQNVGLDAATSGSLMSAVGLGGVLWSFFGTGLADRLGRRRALVLLGALNVMQVVLFLVPGLLARPMLLGAAALLCASGPAVGALVMAVLPADIAGRRDAATAIGFVGIGAELVGGSLAPVLAGALAGQQGLASALWLAVGGGLLVLCVAMRLRETAPGDLALPAKAVVPAADARL